MPKYNTDTCYDTGEECNLVIFGDKTINNYINEKVRRIKRELSIDVVVDSVNNNQIMLFPCFIFLHKTEMRLLKTGVWL